MIISQQRQKYPCTLFASLHVFRENDSQSVGKELYFKSVKAQEKAVTHSIIHINGD